MQAGLFGRESCGTGTPAVLVILRRTLQHRQECLCHTDVGPYMHDYCWESCYFFVAAALSFWYEAASVPFILAIGNRVG
jgi:hypothetical protein